MDRATAPSTAERRAPIGGDRWRRACRPGRGAAAGVLAAVAFGVCAVTAAARPSHRAAVQSGATSAPAPGGPPSCASLPSGSVRQSAGAGGLTVNQADTYKIAQEDGPGSINQTDTRWNVYGADLGSMFLYHGQIRMAFGDSFGGPAAYPFFSVGHQDYRDNLMAMVGPVASPGHGLSFSGMITDSTGQAKDLLATNGTPWPGHLIPTYGVTVGNTMYLYYMNVNQFGAPGHWTLNDAGIAYSNDGGNTWHDSQARWPADTNFGQAALVKCGGYVYEFGIPGGRYGALQLARVPQDELLQTSDYQYWNGQTWVTNDPGAATDVVPAPVGELSVQWNSYYHKWLMMYLIDPNGQIVIRTADQLTGPWSPAQVVVDSTQYPQLYAPYITPLWNDGPDIYFNMSVFDHYQVYLMHTSLTGGGTPQARR
jgi:hypothetical protein